MGFAHRGELLRVFSSSDKYHRTEYAICDLETLCLLECIYIYIYIYIHRCRIMHPLHTLFFSTLENTQQPPGYSPTDPHLGWVGLVWAISALKPAPERSNLRWLLLCHLGIIWVAMGVQNNHNDLCVWQWILRVHVCICKYSKCILYNLFTYSILQYICHDMHQYHAMK